MDVLLRLATWDDCAAVLQKLYAELGKRLTRKEILPELFSLEAITDYEKREIEDGSHSTEDIRNQKILDFLLKKSKNEFQLFLQALRSVSRTDLLNLIVNALKAQLHTHRWIVVTSIDQDNVIDEELVELCLEDEFKVVVERRWMLDKNSMVICFRKDEDRRKALERTILANESLHVRIEEPSFLASSDEHGAEIKVSSAAGVTSRTEMTDAIQIQRVSSESIKQDTTSVVPLSIARPNDQYQNSAHRMLETDSGRSPECRHTQTAQSLSGLPFDCKSPSLAKEDATYSTFEPDCRAAGASVTSMSTVDASTINFDPASYAASETLPTQHQTRSDGYRHADDKVLSQRPSGSVDESTPGARLVFGSHEAASRCIKSQSKEFQSLLKTIKCSIPGPQIDWGDLLVLECNEPFNLPGQEAHLFGIATAIDEFFCTWHES